MMRDIGPRIGQRIQLSEWAGDLSEQLFQRLSVANLAAFFPRIVSAYQLDQTHDVIVINGHAAVHISFAHTQTRVEQYTAFGICRHNSQGDVGPACRSRTENLGCTLLIDDRQRALVNVTVQDAFE